MANCVIEVTPDPDMATERAIIVSLNGTMRAGGQSFDVGELARHPLYPQLVAYVNAHPVAAKAS